MVQIANCNFVLKDLIEQSSAVVVSVRSSLHHHVERIAGAPKQPRLETEPSKNSKSFFCDDICDARSSKRVCI